ncbi:hypothetical protein HOY82DRAFT_640580 [Tuber indicum]|nr:hypothetical protein HOY82DRAFT_640580 [Tuber indicum]
MPNNSITDHLNWVKVTGMKAASNGASQSRFHIYQPEKYLDLCSKRMMGFGIGMVLVGIGAGLSKVYYDDVNRKNELKNYIRDVFGNLEVKMDQSMERMDQSMERMDQSMERMDQCMERMDQCMERMERMDQSMERMGSRLDSMASKMDQKMDEIIAILKAKKGWW